MAFKKDRRLIDQETFSFYAFYIGDDRKIILKGIVPFFMCKCIITEICLFISKILFYWRRTKLRTSIAAVQPF